jgi:hypothetical protein
VDITLDFALAFIHTAFATVASVVGLIKLEEGLLGDFLISFAVQLNKPKVGAFFMCFRKEQTVLSETDRKFAYERLCKTWIYNLRGSFHLLSKAKLILELLFNCF